jgi:16S rRNA processing protein RimM
MEENPQTGPPPDVSPDDLVEIGEILKPRGLKGEVKVRIACDGPDDFVECLMDRDVYVWKTASPRGEGARCAREPVRTMRVRGIRFHEGFALVTFDGVEHIDAAEPLRGYRMGLPSSQLPDPGEDSYYHFELEGLAVVLPTGETIGRVTRVEEGLAHDQLLVQPLEEGAKPFRVPMVAAFVKTVDVAGGRVLVDPPPGLIESQR